VSELNADWIRDLKAQSGKDIWLFGGSSLFRSFFDSGLVDGVEVAVVPVLLGSGIPLLPPQRLKPVLKRSLLSQR
jgi:dihydrofolate reductase